MNLDILQARYPALLPDAFAKEVDTAAANVRVWRDYVVGNQYIYLTEKQRRALNIQTAPYRGFAANYMNMVISMMAARLQVTGFVCSDPDWLAEWSSRNSFDALQSQLHTALLREGDAFLLLDYDERNASCLRLAYPYDGKSGIIPIYDGYRLDSAIKVWQDGDTVHSDLWQEGVVHFTNRAYPGSYGGRSEVSDVISLQDALNRIIASMIIAGELSAFQVRVAKGFNPPSSIEPGAIIPIKGTPEQLAQADMYALQQGSLVEFISEIDRVIDLIAEITQTPIASVLGTNPSGEALKQRESGLIAKVKAAQIAINDSWSSALTMCYAADRLYAGASTDKFVAEVRWSGEDTRSIPGEVALAIQIYQATMDKTLLAQMLGDALGWTLERQEEVLQRMIDAEAQHADQLLASIPGGAYLNGPRGRAE